MQILKRNADAGRLAELESVSKALDKVQAVIWFDPNGNILDANENFLNAVGYVREEIVGKHHRIFVADDYAQTPDYAAFWERLGSGETYQGEFARVRKDGAAIYIEASYNPILAADGTVEKVVKFAIDVTDKKLAAAEAKGQIDAINRSQAVIEFEPDGTIITANDNFLNAMDYSLAEVQGKHHRMFVEPGYGESDEYRAFWRDLAAGKFSASEFKRIAKGGREIWIQASYNPIFDPSGQVFKVVKYASDITEAKVKSADHEGQINAVLRTQAVIEFELDGTIRTANENFLKTTGYRLDEIVGKNHGMFVHPEYAKSEKFKEFWRDLARGEVKAAEYKRFAKDGTEIWLQASYNPIFDPSGKPYKVVKYATDISHWKGELQIIVDSLVALSKGDLTLRLEETGSLDFTELRTAFNTTLDKLRELVGDIHFSASSIREESDAIADSANDLSARCERQAATVEETSASMEQMSSTVKSNAKNAEEAAAAAKQASEHAESGGAIVKNAIDAMSRIEEGSAEVRKIIEVIDSIAFQTNLLALNAGVEAARAGEAGSGFAVVASEVRALAQRASESAREISSLIGNSEKQVTEGAELVKKTGVALDEIVASVTRVTSGIDEIFTASSEQAAGIGEINQAMSEIDSTTQKTAAISEESTAAAANLAQRAKGLRELVGFFNTGNEAAAKVQPVPAAKAPEPEVPAAKAKPVPEPAPTVSGALALKSSHEADDWEEF